MYQRLHWFVIVYVMVIIGNTAEFPWLIISMIGAGLYLHYVLSYPKWFTTSLFLFALSLQIILPSTTSQQPPNIPTETQTVQGTITSMIDRKETYLRFQIQIDGYPHKTEVYYFNNTSQETLLPLRTGARCTLTGSFQEIPTARNPGEFDYKNYLFTQGVSSQFILESSHLTACTGSSAIDSVYQLRFFLMNSMQEKVSSTTYAWLAALLFGDRSQLDEEIIALFQNWQLSHLLAISGLHVGLLLSIVFFVCLYIFGMTVERAYFLLLIFLPFYPFLSGGAPSVWRAALLAIAFILLRKLPIRMSTTDVLSIIFLSLVFIDPFLIYSLAFQFSFLVTYSMLFSRKLLTEPTVGKQWIMLRVSLISMWIILPLQLHHFYEFHPMSVLINLIVIPYFSFFVLPMLISIMFLSSFSSVFLIFDHIFQKAQELFINCLELVDNLFQWSWLLGSFPAYYYPLFYLLLGFFFVYFENGKRKKAFISGVLLVLILVFIAIRPHTNPAGYITVLDIGQGDAIVIELPYRAGVFMIDAGGELSKDFSEASAETFEQIIDPFLRSKGIHHIDAIFVSHEDLDHIGSIPYILKDYSVDYLITSAYFDPRIIETYHDINAKTEHIIAHAGEQLTIKDHVFYIPFPSSPQQNENENSLVIHSHFGGKEWLFTGDIGKESEKKLTDHYPDLRADIVKVAHHGSNTSTSSAFLEHVEPTFGLISAGRNNRYGHPHQEVLENLHEHGVHTLRTDRSGAIIFQFTESAGTLSTYLP